MIFTLGRAEIAASAGIDNIYTILLLPASAI
jgi:hypothetical protein